MNKSKSTDEISAGNTSGVLPEFGRTRDVERLFGIKRGTLYNLLSDGHIRGVVLRVRGQKSGVRLFHLASVRDFIYRQMAEQPLA